MAQLLEGSIIRKSTGDEIIATLIDITNRVKTPVPENAKFIALGETSATAYRGDRGKIAYDHSQVAHAPSNAQKNSDITKAEIEAKLTGAITTHTHTFATLTSRPTTLKGYGLTEIETSLRATTSELTVLGVDAALNLTGDGGQGSTAFGYKAAESAVESRWFTAIGRNAGQFNVSGHRWSAFGQNAGQNNISASNWTAFGANAGRGNITGDAWTAIGNNAGENNTTGRAWAAIGAQAGQYNTTGRSWTAIGFDAAKENLTGNAWTAIGNNAGYSALGSFWTSIGTQAGMHNTMSESVSIGFKTAENLADGTSPAISFANSVHIGSRAKVSADGVTNEIAIGYNVIGKGSNTVVIGNDDITDTYLKGEVHASIAASMITESATKRFVTDTEKSTWNAKSNLALGTTSTTAYRGDRGKIAYDHSQVAHAPSNAQKNSDITKAEIEAKLTGAITSHTHKSIPITYAELNSLISSNSLVAQQRYTITDYQTVYTIPNTTEIKECDIEPLLVTAVTNNSLYPLAYSLIHTDDIIYYNIENNQEQVKGCTKGYISRRIDGRKNNDVGFDFRNVVFRRWQVTANEYNSGTTYAKNAVVKLGDKFYASCTAGNVGNLVTNKEFWIDLQLPDLQYIGHNSTGNVSQLKFVPTGEFLDYPMFIKYDTSEGIQGNNFRQRRMDREWVPNEDLISANNMVFFNDVIENNIFSSRNQNTTFFKPDNQPSNNYIVTNNTFNFINYYNLFNCGALNNNIENHFRYNFISCPTTAEPSGSNGFRNNTIGIDYRYNIISPMVPSGTQFGWNTILNSFNNNYIHNIVNANDIANYFNNNNISSRFTSNNINGMMQNNLITGEVVSYLHSVTVFVNNKFRGSLASCSTLGVVQGVVSNGNLSRVIFEGGNVNVTLPNSGITGVTIGQGLSNKDYSLDTTDEGSKLYNTIPLLPSITPTLDNHVTSKKYVDDRLASKIDASGVQVVEELPASPTAGVFYFIKE